MLRGERTRAADGIMWPLCRRVRKIGSVKRGAGFSREVGLPPDAGSRRIVVFVQDSDQGRVFGAAMSGPAQN